MQKIYLPTLFIIALNCFNSDTTYAKKPIDSIGVENVEGLKVIIYQAEAKETYYSIARRYNVNPKDILSYNDNKFLNVGTVIKVPTKTPFHSSSAESNAQSAGAASFFSYTVAPKDNLNLLAEKYGTTINFLKEINGLTGSNLSIGQVLKIPVTEKATELGAIAATKATAAVVKPVSPTVETPTVITQAAIITADNFREHIVAPREYLNKIAENYGTTAEEIKKLNNLTSNNLKIGQRLKIPSSGGTEVVAQDNGAQTLINVPAKQADGMHSVINGETIFTLAKKYGITAYQIRQANNLKDNNLKIGQTLKMPSNIVIDVEVPKSEQNKRVNEVVETAPSGKNSFDYLVTSGEDIYSIAKKFKLTTYQIKTANNLTSSKLAVGQKLLIPKPPEPLSVNEASIEAQTESPDSLTLKDPKLRRDPSVYGLSQSEQKGMGIWISDQDLDGSKMLVLHRTAPIGTVIKITNPMTNISTFAKVVGKFTENESTKDVIVVMTKAVADSLGALDKRFLCNIMYAQ